MRTPFASLLRRCLGTNPPPAHSATVVETRVVLIGTEFPRNRRHGSFGVDILFMVRGRRTFARPVRLSLDAASVDRLLEQLALARDSARARGA